MLRPDKPAATVTRARRLRKQMSLPEVLPWRELRGSPEGLRFRKQHPAGAYVLDFFCARANLAIEIDGIGHDMGNRPQIDADCDAWLKQRRIDTVRIAARDVLRDPQELAQAVVRLTQERLERFGKTPPSALRAATSPMQVIGKD